MRLLGCELVVGDPELSAKLEQALSKVCTMEEMEAVCPGLVGGAMEAMKSLEKRRLRAERLQVEGRTVRAIPSSLFDREDTCVPGPSPCPCGMTHGPDFQSPRSPRISF